MAFKKILQFIKIFLPQKGAQEIPAEEMEKKVAEMKKRIELRRAKQSK